MVYFVQENPITLFTLTSCHRSPAYSPACHIPSFVKVICIEEKFDHIALASHLGRKAGEHILASDNNIAVIGGAATLPHQGCPVTISDYQVVTLTVECTILDVESSEL